LLGRRTVSDEDWRAIALAGVDAEAAEDAVTAIVAGHLDFAATLRSWFGVSAHVIPQALAQVIPQGVVLMS
jgi:hypothetical protein